MLWVEVMGARNVLGLAHAFRFFSENGFLSIVPRKGASEMELPSHYMYGSNGGLLRHNFLNEWYVLRYINIFVLPEEILPWSSIFAISLIGKYAKIKSLVILDFTNP